MVRSDGAEVRRGRIQKTTSFVLSLLHKNNGQIPLAKTLALLQYETGLTREKLIEYIFIGADTGHFIVDVENDKITKVTNSDL